MYENISLNVTQSGLVTSFQFIVISCFLALCGIVGLIVNCTTFFVFIAVPALRCPTNIFIMAVVLCDIVISTLGIPFSAVASVYNRWIFGDAGCSWYGFIMSFLGYTSIYLLTAISVERYLLITNPFSRPMITNARAIGITLACVALALCLSVAPLFGWSSYGLEGARISCSVNWQSDDYVDVSYIITVFVLGLFAPLTVMVFSYFRIFLTVRSLAKHPLWGENSHVTRRNFKMEYRTTRNIVLVIGAFFLSWTPYAVVSLWATFGNPKDISPLAGTVPALMAKSSVVWNPLIYVLTNEQFRIRLTSLLPCRCQQHDSEGNQNDADEDREMVLIEKATQLQIPGETYCGIAENCITESDATVQYLSVAAKGYDLFPGSTESDLDVPEGQHS